MNNADKIIHEKHTLWLGNIESAQDKKFLKENNIKIVFNITNKLYIEFENIEYI